MSWSQKIREAPRFTGTKYEIVKILDPVTEKHIGWRVFTLRGKDKGYKDYPLGTSLYKFGDPCEFYSSYEPVYAKKPRTTAKKPTAKKLPAKKPPAKKSPAKKPPAKSGPAK